MSDASEVVPGSAPWFTLFNALVNDYFCASDFDSRDRQLAMFCDVRSAWTEALRPSLHFVYRSLERGNSVVQSAVSLGDFFTNAEYPRCLQQRSARDWVIAEDYRAANMKGGAS